MKLKNKGFSLAGVMVAAALLGGISLGVMQLMKNMNQGHNFAQSKADEIELKTSIRLLLDDERHCRLSLAGDGPSGSPTSPVTFNKKDIDEVNEGLDVALYLSNQAGDARGLKKFNGSNNPGSNDLSNYGKLTITSMKLVMNNGTGNSYSESMGHNDIGQLRVVAQKKVSSNQTRDVLMTFDLNVGMRTDSSGLTTILSCSREGVDQVSISPGSFICFSALRWDHHDQNSLDCVAPTSGYYRGIDYYRGGAAASNRFYANKGDAIRIEGFWIGGDNGCYERIKVNGAEVHGGWGDNGCHNSLSNYAFIYSYDQ